MAEQNELIRALRERYAGETGMGDNPGFSVFGSPAATAPTNMGQLFTQARGNALNPTILALRAVSDDKSVNASDNTGTKTLANPQRNASRGYDMGLGGDGPTAPNIGNAYGANGMPNAFTSGLATMANALNITSPQQGALHGLAGLATGNIFAPLMGAALGNAAQQAQNTNMSMIAESNNNEGASVPNGLTADEQAAIDAIGSYAESIAPGSDPSMGNDTVGFGSYGEQGSGDGGGGGGGKIICTELHRQGLMPREIFEADQAFGRQLVATQPHVYDGYVRWARTVVEWMQSPTLWGRFVTKAAHVIATPWSLEMARRMGVPVKKTVAGWLLMEGGLRLCGLLGRKNLEHAASH